MMSIPATRRPKAVHPGGILQRMFLDELKITQKDLAKAIGVKPQYINNIVQGNIAISPLMARKLEIALGVDASMWLRLQAAWDLQEACQKVIPPIKVLHTPEPMPGMVAA